MTLSLCSFVPLRRGDELEPTLGKRIGNGRAAEVFEYGQGRVIKLWREPGQHAWVAREAQAQRAVIAAGVPAPAIIAEAEVEGRPGIVMEQVAGLDGLTAAEKKPWRIWSIGTATGRLHRQLAGVPAPVELPTVVDMVRHDITHSSNIPESARARLLTLLERAPHRRTLCHLDFHPGNVMETPSGYMVIDLANACAGDPLADHAKSLLLLRVGSPAEVSAWERVVITLGRRLMAAAYRSGYGAVDEHALALWEPLVIAMRLSEGLPEERVALLRMLSSSLRATEKPP